MTKTKIKLKLLIIGSLFILITIILWFSNSNAYYTNINKYFSDSRIADGYSGFALQRYSNEFIVDGVEEVNLDEVIKELEGTGN